MLGIENPEVNHSTIGSKEEKDFSASFINLLKVRNVSFERPNGEIETQTSCASIALRIAPNPNIGIKKNWIQKWKHYYIENVSQILFYKISCFHEVVFQKN